MRRDKNRVLCGKFSLSLDFDKFSSFTSVWLKRSAELMSCSKNADKIITVLISWELDSGRHVKVFHFRKRDSDDIVNSIIYENFSNDDFECDVKRTLPLPEANIRLLGLHEATDKSIFNFADSKVDFEWKFSSWRARPRWHASERFLESRLASETERRRRRKSAGEKKSR